MARLQDFQTVTPTSSDKLLVVQSQGQGLVPYGDAILNKAPKTDLAARSITGSTNTGAEITAGTFFYLNGALVRAKRNIANGDTLTSGTNYETVTDGGLNDLSVNELVLDSSVMTFDNGVSLYSGGSNRIIYNGSLVIVQVSIKLTGAVVNSPLSISNYIPPSYRPLYNKNYNGETGLGDGKNQSFNILSSGLLKMFPCNAGTTYCIGTGVYFRG